MFQLKTLLAKSTPLSDASWCNFITLSNVGNDSPNSLFRYSLSVNNFFSFIIIGSIGTYINRKTIEWVEDKTLKDGLLKVSLERIIPESKKPRTIEIK